LNFRLLRLIKISATADVESFNRRAASARLNPNSEVSLSVQSQSSAAASCLNQNAAFPAVTRYKLGCHFTPIKMVGLVK
jgi:hypothetical protein